jgi:hypothetical protein
MAALFKEPTSPYATAVTALSGAQPGSMPKGEADKHYEQAMAAANVYMAHGVKTGDVNKGHEAVLKWKKQKAAAMAAWAQAVHGKTNVPAAQQIYKADEQLATDIAQGKAMSVAIAEWKTNTGLEKSGLFPAPKEPKGATPAQVMQMAKAGGADMGHPEHVQPHEYASLVPAHHTHIGPGDFATPQGEWYKGILKFKNDLESQSAVNAQSNKKSVEHKLRERLKDKPNFQALVKRLGLSKEGPGSLESRLIQTWAGSSGDGNALSVSMQLAVRTRSASLTRTSRRRRCPHSTRTATRRSCSRRRCTASTRTSTRCSRTKSRRRSTPCGSSCRRSMPRRSNCSRSRVTITCTSRGACTRRRRTATRTARRTSSCSRRHPSARTTPRPTSSAAVRHGVPRQGPA